MTIIGVKRIMMYNNKMVAILKVGNKVLREQGDTVFIPFGSEYDIHFRNLHSTKAVIDIDIDGEDVLNGSQLVINPNESGKLEGFMKDDRVTHKFKFIEKTQEISDYRGDKIADGIIRISFKYETSLNNWFRAASFNPPTYRNSGGDLYGSAGDYLNHQPVTMCSVGGFDNDDGITVKGGDSDQTFVTTTVGALESEEHVIVFQLKGDTKSGKITKPVLVKTKITCDTCGKKNFSKNKFCSNCGTSLVI